MKERKNKEERQKIQRKLKIKVKINAKRGYRKKKVKTGACRVNFSIMQEGKKYHLRKGGGKNYVF